jgi:hypothetical protein
MIGDGPTYRYFSVETRDHPDGGFFAFAQPQCPIEMGHCTLHTTRFASERYAIQAAFDAVDLWWPPNEDRVIRNLRVAA